MRRALVAGLLVAVTTSLVGTWVVLRGMAFMGDALAHGVVPGLAAALLLGIHPVVGAFAAAAVMVGAIAAIHRATRLREDTAIGLLFVGMLALGVVVVSRSRSFAVDLVAILFGDVLGVSTGDVVASGVVAAATAVAVALLYRPLLVLSFNEEKAEVLSLHPRATHLALLVLVTLAIVSSFRTVGALLVFGLLIGPPATASLLTRRVPAMMAVAAAVGAASVVTGLVLGYHLDTAGGATMALVAISSFFVVLALRALRRGVDAAG
ncbi:MAG TPA: metal ABC transporter permease [Actinobacteria bacterium]|nr:metal ABC transporter permease [Actinomycetota bacterium]